MSDREIWRKSFSVISLIEDLVGGITGGASGPPPPPPSPPTPNDYLGNPYLTR